MGKFLDELRLQGLWPGKYRAEVVESNDPKKLMRVRCVIPEVLGPSVVSDWAKPVVPLLAAKGAGFVAVPPVNSRVWVEFESWDVNRPIWVGYWYAEPDGKSEAPDELTGSYGEVYGIRTPGGNIVTINDGTGEVSLTNKNGDNVTVKSGIVNVIAKSGTVVIDANNVRIN